MTEKILEIINFLKGTCHPISNAEEEYGELTVEELEEIDEEIFKCDDCGWWYDPCDCNVDHNGSKFCPNCYDEIYSDYDDDDYIFKDKDDDMFEDEEDE